MQHRVKTCTQGSWCVSATTGDSVQGAILSVFRVYENPAKIGTMEHTRYAYGDGNDKRFPSAEAAFAYALEHGYLQKYYDNAMWSTSKGSKEYRDLLRQMTLRYRREAGQKITLKRHA